MTYPIISTYSDPADCFNCEAPGLHGFLKEVQGRASRFGWRDAILEIPNNITNPLGGNKNLLTHYSELTLEHLHAWEITYLHGISRAAQDMAHLHLCLMNSLTHSGKDKVRLWSDQFILNGRESGILLLKIIIRESHLDVQIPPSAPHWWRATLLRLRAAYGKTHALSFFIIPYLY